MCIVFVILLIGFLIIGNPYALLLALVISIVDLLPILGTGTILIPWTLNLFFTKRLSSGDVPYHFICCVSGCKTVPAAKDDS